jgi:uncharacterized protein GlcG (DUF336 family)
MESDIDRTVAAMIRIAGGLLPDMLANPADRGIQGGNVSMCIVAPDGSVHGAMWGDDKIRQRSTYQTAWRKASQVWLTGIQTGKFEELVFTRQIDWMKFGIQKPDFIGWEGGWLAEFPGGLRFCVAVSGMRGESDTALVKQTVAQAGGSVLSS